MARSARVGILLAMNMPNRNARVCTIAAAALGLLVASMPCAAANTARLAATLGAMLASPDTTSAVGGEPLYRARVLARFYAARADGPGWVTENGPEPRVAQLLDAICASESEGLRPVDYHYDALSILLDRLAQPSSNDDEREQRLAALELLASDAFLVLASDAFNGRTNPAGFEYAADFKPRREDFTGDLTRVLAGADPQAVIQGLWPQSAEYRALRDALATERARAAGDAGTRVTDGPALRMGASGARVEALRLRLVASGDLGADGASVGEFDAGLAAAVKRFQARHGLASDGVAGRATLAALNEPTTARVARLRVNLERLRWLPRVLPARRLVVNIADFSGTLYDQNRALLVANTVVGTLDRQTPEFSARIQYLVVNPSWEVPASIASQELLPQAQRHPDYLRRHGYQVLAGAGASERVLDPRHIAWRRWSAATLPYRFRQKPGPENALGRVKFVFPNPDDVYLHDTPAQGLFARQQRTFSHGCVRVASALELAAALLRLDGETDPQALLAAALASGKTRQFDLRQPVAIYIVYLTTWVNPDGMLESRPDVYGRDAQVLGALDGKSAQTAPRLSGLVHARIARAGGCLGAPGPGV